VHHQRAHKDWYDARLEPATDRVRWSAEEVAFLARKEVDLLKQVPPPIFVNQELLTFFPQRTLEAIKGRRRRQDYKDMVARFLEEAEDRREPDAEDPCREDALLEYLESLPQMRSDAFQAIQLHNIVANARNTGREATLQRLTLYLREIFPPPSRKQPHTPKVPPAPKNKREERRRAYAITQELWKKNKKSCITSILEDLPANLQPPRNLMEPYWTKVMSTNATIAPSSRRRGDVAEIWDPILIEDLRWGRVPRTSAAGPDVISSVPVNSWPDLSQNL